MKVALVSSGFPPEVGGVERTVQRLAIALAGLGCSIDVITQSPPDMPMDALDSDSQDAGVRVLRFKDWTHTRQFRASPGLWSYLHGYGRRYDVIHAHNFHALPALAAAVTTDQTLVLTPYYHGGGHSLVAKALHAPYGLAARKLFARSTSVLCISQAEQAKIIADYPKLEGRICLVGVGVDIDAIRKAQPYPLVRPVIVVVGRLERYKQVDRVVAAFAAIKIPADLVVIGTGPEEGRIAEAVRDLGIESRVKVLGNLDEESVRRWQRSATAVISLSLAESFGLGLAEGAVAGARVVASDVPAHREVSAMTGDRFIFVAPDASRSEIANALTKALTSDPPVDDGWTLPSWDVIARRHLTLYREASATVA